MTVCGHTEPKEALKAGTTEVDRVTVVVVSQRLFFMCRAPPSGAWRAGRRGVSETNLSPSTRGAQIQGSRSGAQVGATITPPEEGRGKPVDFNVSVPSIKEGDNRWILLAEGGKLGIKGAKKGAQAGFIDERVAL